MSEKIITRFAPSPTGNPHLGSLRNALYSWLVARQSGGKFLLRIEDTDRKRLKEESADQIIEMLKWTGLDWDEDVVYQSDRKGVYREYAEKLVETGKAYYCFCSPEDLQNMRKEQLEKGLKPGYDGRCARLTLDEVNKKIKDGLPKAIRFKMPDGGEIEGVDIIKGRVVFQAESQEDFIILKADGYPTYHLASVVDDHLFGVNYVLRSEEWLSSLPKHIKIYEALGWSLPRFAHLPLILAPDKSKLSKRHGAVSVFDFRNEGILPEALINFVLLLGWHPKKGDEQEIFSRDEMLEKFRLDDVQTSPAIFDREKLEWINGVYIRKLSLSKLADLSKPFFERAGIDIGDRDLEKIVSLEQQRIRKLTEIPEKVSFVFQLPEYESDLLVWKKSDKKNTKKALSDLYVWLESIPEEKWNKEYLEDNIKTKIEENGWGMGDVLWPMRVALTGMRHSPGPFECADVLGREETLRRIKQAGEKLSSEYDK